MSRYKPKLHRLTRRQRSRWLRYVGHLKRSLPTPYPVSVRTRSIARNDCGDAELIRDQRARRFVIRISSFLTWQERVETLIHEYAHCLDWSHRHDVTEADCHDESWGVWYSKVYRIIEALTEELTSD